MRALRLSAFASIVVLTAGWALLSPVGAAGTRVADRIANYAYAPNPMRVPVGTTVVWTNEDRAPHTVTSTRGPARLDSPSLSQGQSWSFAFTKAGTYSYYCAVHPNMQATLVVDAAPTTAVAGAAVAPPVPLITTTTTTSPGGLHVNPLLFLLAVVGGVVVFCLLAVASGRDPTDP